MTALIPVGPGIKDPAAVAVLKSHEDALRSLLAGTAVLPVLTTTTTTLAANPIPKSAIAVASDLPALLFSDGTNWRRADGTIVV